MQIVPFDSAAQLPAAVTAMFGSSQANDLVGNNAGGGFPVISIKGKVFHIVRGKEKTLVTKPGEEDTPASALEGVIIKANPNRSKVFYASGYVEGGDSKPDCYSNDGITPAADSQQPQSLKCATCQHNQWGSRITQSGTKGKACADHRRIAFATVDTPADPMLMRVPAASMKALEEFGKLLATRGIRPEMVVTRVGFDYTVAHPQLTFKPVGIISDADVLREIHAASQLDIAAQITGMTPMPRTESEENEDIPVLPPKAAPVAAAATVTAAVAAAANVTPVSVQVATPAPAPAASAAPAAAPAAVTPPPSAAPAAPASAALQSQISSMLGDMDFDD
jgi:hypothetical protein